MNIQLSFSIVLNFIGLCVFVGGFTNGLLLHAKNRNLLLSSERAVSPRFDTRLLYKSQNALETEVTVWKEIVRHVADALSHIGVLTRSGKNSSVVFDEARDTAKRYRLQLIKSTTEDVDCLIRAKFPDISVLNAQVIVQKSLNKEIAVIRCFTHLVSSCNR